MPKQDRTEMLKLSWRNKLYLFAVAIAVIPIAIASYNMISITETESISNVNERLINTTDELAQDINSLYTDSWINPLLLTKSGLESTALTGNAKLSLLPSLIDNSAEMLTTALYLEIAPGNFSLATKANDENFITKLRDNSLDPAQYTDYTSGNFNNISGETISIEAPSYISELNEWITAIYIPVKVPLENTNRIVNGYLTSKYSLETLRTTIENHPYTDRGKILLVDVNGNKVFSPEQENLMNVPIVEEAINLLKSGSRSQAVKMYSTDGEKVLGCYAFPENLDWAVIAEINESEAYAAVHKMQDSLIIWVIIGLVFAFAGIFFLSNQISKPILKLSSSAKEISSGNFDIKVDYKADDEIGLLGSTLEDMSNSLKESFAKIEQQNKELEEYSRTLEDKVEQRTAELKDKNTELEKLLKKLKETQAQLVTQEKLASLGALTAGIAHEIQNPLNFVNNFSKLSKSLAEELAEELEGVKSSLDGEDYSIIGEILDDIKMNVGKIAEHGKRAESIVKGMLQHSRGDSGQMQETNLNEMIDETINLAFHGFRSHDSDFNIKIEKDFDKKIGKIKLNPQAFNRVLLNIVNNGLYAANEKIKSAGKDFEPVFNASTKLVNDKVEIRLRDNGTGIPQKVLEKIFEPFFTTKPTGQGTGLGLSLSYDIVVQMHKGEIDVDTKEGQYTEFILRIPRDLD